MGVCETGLLYVKLRDWPEDFCIESILKNKQKNMSGFRGECVFLSNSP